MSTSSVPDPAAGRDEIETTRLTLVPKKLDDVRAEIKAMGADERGQLSPDWLAQLDRPAVDSWTLGFAMVSRITGRVIGGCGFKGPPDLDGSVEIAYGIASDQEGQGYATEAAAALVAYAFSFKEVQVVRAHTLSHSNRSARVLARCGFQLLGEVVDPEDGLVWRWETSRPADASVVGNRDLAR
jgi:RimJ/RimL family protein N-acetyltransferase